MTGTNQLEITDSVVIDGLGADLVAVSGNGRSRVFLIDDGVGSSLIDVEISGVTIRSGNTAPGIFGLNSGEAGAGILNTENLTLRDVSVTSNTTIAPLIVETPEQDGGGIHHSLGMLQIEDSTFSDNSAVNGGAIAIASGIVTIDNSTLRDSFARNNGGGISIVSGTLNVINESTLGGDASIARESNSATNGGAIFAGNIQQ